MPNLNGIDLCRLVRERASSPYQYILLVTAKDDKQDLVRGLEAGADDYLSKPFDRDELRARLRTGRRILTLQDEQLKAREELRLQATHDGLTGTWNRNAILDLLHREYELAARTGSTIGVIMLDVDHFKQVNDTYGHLAGDHVLVEAARRMQEAVRSYDLVGRYGGEEFLVVSPDCDREQIQICAERIRSAMAEQPVLALDSRIPITVSAGTAVLVPRLNSEKDALAAADTALYRAKSGGEFVGIAGVAVAAGKLASAIGVDGPGKAQPSPGNTPVEDRPNLERAYLQLMSLARRGGSRGQPGNAGQRGASRNRFAVHSREAG
jgi:diguanylate cyclase (GGDEF)-like protein